MRNSPPPNKGTLDCRIALLNAMSQPDQAITGLSVHDLHFIHERNDRVLKFLSDMCDTCDYFMMTPNCHSCGKEKLASCQGRLPSFFYALHELVEEHFDYEKKIISEGLLSSNDSHYLRAHKHEHKQLVGHLKRLIQQSALLSRRGDVAIALKQLYLLIADIFGEQAPALGHALLTAAATFAVQPISTKTDGFMPVYAS